jgi:hypothetical protein
LLPMVQFVTKFSVVISVSLRPPPRLLSCPTSSFLFAHHCIIPKTCLPTIWEHG